MKRGHAIVPWSENHLSWHLDDGPILPINNYICTSLYYMNFSHNVQLQGLCNERLITTGFLISAFTWLHPQKTKGRSTPETLSVIVRTHVCQRPRYKRCGSLTHLVKMCFCFFWKGKKNFFVLMSIWNDI